MSGTSGIDILSITTPLPDTSFVVSGLTASECLSRPFTYVVSLNAGTQLLNPNDLLDQKVTVQLGDTDSGRYFNGIVSTVQQMPAPNGVLWAYTLTIVPKLWFLGQTRACRFYHSQSVPDIVKSLCDTYSITVDDKLQGTYATRDYTVQYNESYLYFIQRILEDEGIFYFFTHSATDHTLVLADSKSAFVALAQDSVNVGGGNVGIYALKSWYREDSTALGEVKVGDYNPEVDTLVLNSTGGTTPTILQATGASNRTFYSWPAVRGTSSEAQARAKWHMEAAEAAAELYTGTGVAKDFFPGGKLTITNDPSQGGDADGNYVLRSVEYAVIDSSDGSGGGSIDVNMACTAFPLDTQWREMPSHPPPVMAGVYTAKVIGPPGEEIYVDDLGRIKVWFPWDEHSDITPDNTLWVRVMQPWGGGNWGHQFIPRVGMEVIVAFLEGDVNRPLVVGSIYNNAMPPTFSASDKNKSGFRTRSTMNGGSDNYNEVSFDDTMGSEVMLLHAEKDYNLEVENDQSVTVDNDRSVTVTNDETVQISGKQTITVTKDRTLTVSQGNMATAVSQGNHSITVDTGNHAMKVTTGNHSTEVNTGNVSTKVDVGNVDTTVTTGNVTLNLSIGSISYQAMQSITLKSGPSSITISPEGITLQGIKIQVQGTGLVGLQAPIVQVQADGNLMMSGGITMIN